MKLLPIVAAALLAVPAEADEQPKMTFVEGMCAGVVLGLASGVVIVVAIRCWQKPPPIVQSTNAPGWTVLPPAGTNSPPPPGTNVTATIDAGPAVEHVDLSQTGTGFTEGMRFVLEASEDGVSFTPIYQIKCWLSNDIQFTAAFDLAGEVVATNISHEKVVALPVPLAEGPQRFFRVRHP